MHSKTKTVAILAPYTNGYLEYVVEWMRLQGHVCDVLYLDNPDFSVYTLRGKLSSALRKTITGSSLRKHKRRLHIFKNIPTGKYDTILAVRPELMDAKTHRYLRSATNDYVTYFYDSLTCVPKQKEVLPFAHRTFTFDPEDADKYKIPLRTNFIPFLTDKNFQKTQAIDSGFYYIGALNKRIKKVSRLADYLKQNELTFDFCIVSQKELPQYSNLQLLQKHIPISEVYESYYKAKFLVDFQREGNTGLSFRIFEAMGLQKKLITDNEDVKNYDFYNPNNILILNFSEEIEIPQTFLDSPYQDVSDEVLEQYTIRGWTNEIFDLQEIEVLECV